jgi:hypothetical protein
MSKATDVIDILESAAVDQVKDVVKWAKDKFFSQFDMPVPDVKIRDNLGAGWLARHKCTKDKKDVVIEVQKSILDDDRTLRRCITHEMIHNWQCYFEVEDKDFGRDYQKIMRRVGVDRAHGDSFQQWADKINKIMGDNYVTKTSDTEYLQSETKEFFILVAPSKSSRYAGKMSYAYFSRPSEKMKQAIDMSSTYDTARVFKTKNRRFLRGQVFKVYGPLSIPSDEETQKLLKDIYDSGERVKF